MCNGDRYIIMNGTGSSGWKRKEEAKEEVLVVIWKDWRPNVQIAPINRIGGWWAAVM